MCKKLARSGGKLVGVANANDELPCRPRVGQLDRADIVERLVLLYGFRRQNGETKIQVYQAARRIESRDVGPIPDGSPVLMGNSAGQRM